MKAKGARVPRKVATLLRKHAKLQLYYSKIRSNRDPPVKNRRAKPLIRMTSTAQAAGSSLLHSTTPYHSWERGTNENTNGLIRQYIPKGQDLKDLTQTKCNWIAKELNTRPRKRYGMKTPKELLCLSGGGVALDG